MRFLFDNNLSPDAAILLRQSGVSATHVKEIGHIAASDVTIMRLALERGEVVVTRDNDFPEILAHSKALGPSVVLLRDGTPTKPVDLATLLLDLPESAVFALGEGAVVSIDGRKIRIRRLPIL